MLWINQINHPGSLWPIYLEFCIRSWIDIPFINQGFNFLRSAFIYHENQEISCGSSSRGLQSTEIYNSIVSKAIFQANILDILTRTFHQKDQKRLFFRLPSPFIYSHLSRSLFSHLLSASQDCDQRRRIQNVFTQISCVNLKFLAN